MAGDAINPWPVFMIFMALFLCVLFGMVIHRYHLHFIPETGTARDASRAGGRACSAHPDGPLVVFFTAGRAAQHSSLWLASSSAASTFSSPAVCPAAAALPTCPVSRY